MADLWGVLEGHLTDEQAGWNTASSVAGEGFQQDKGAYPDADIPSLCLRITRRGVRLNADMVGKIEPFNATTADDVAPGH